MTALSFVELFAGVGGLSMGLERAGWHCLAHAEIEAFPRRVLAQRWPATQLDGDVVAIHGGRYRGVTLLSGGSPCQDLSVAGRRRGMVEGSGTRSSLFHEQVRIWRESDAPYFLWENVLGAFSSNNGADFAAVLSTLVGAALAVPADGWQSGGVAAGGAGVAAWRVLDAQFFGVPQRRRRVFVLCARAGGVDPAEVLALGESLRGDSPPRAQTRQGAPSDAAAGARGGGGFSESGPGFWRAGVGPLRAEGENRPSRPSTVISIQHDVVAFDTKGTQVQHDHELSQPVRQAGEGGHLGVVAFDGLNHDAASIHHTLRTGVDSGDFVFDARGNGDGVTAPPLTGDHANRVSDYTALVFTMQSLGEYAEKGVASTIKERDHKDATDIVVGTLNGTQRQEVDGAMAAQSGRPRRLLPIECERLMGWPDGWTNVGAARQGKPELPVADSPRYKACGNGVASPVVHWIGLRLAEAIRALDGASCA